MTDVYEFSEFDRHNLIYSFSTMTPAEIETATVKAKKMEEEATVKKAAAAAAAKAAADAKAAAQAATPASQPEGSQQKPE